MNLATAFSLQSAIILFLIYLGSYFIFIKKRKLHVILMGLAILWDVILILQIEFSRSAIATASKVVSNQLIMNVHVALALLTVLQYGFLVYFGRQLLKGNRTNLKWHKRFGLLTIATRTLVFVTSFFVPTTGA